MKYNTKTILIVVGIGIAAIILANVLLKRDDFEDSKDWFDKTTKWYNDKNTLEIVKNLHPKFRNKIAEFFTKIEKELGLGVIATSGYRTIEKQAELHRQNPSNAKPGYSSHNFGFAIDMNVKDKNGNIILMKSSSDKKWIDSKVVDLAKTIGLSWGGGGAFGNYHDPVHFYIKPNGLSTTDLRKMYNEGKKDSQGYVTV